MQSNIKQEITETPSPSQRKGGLNKKYTLDNKIMSKSNLNYYKTN